MNDVIDVTAASNNSWSVSLFYANGTPLSDTDGDTIVDVGNLSGGKSADITISIVVPSVPIGTVEETTITINSSVDATSRSVTDTTTIEKRVKIDPLSQQSQEIGIGATVLYHFAVYNNWNESDTINLNISSSEGWPIELFEEDEVTPLTDTNSDNIIDTGIMDTNGGSTVIVLKVTVPSGTQENTTDTTNITAFSSLDPSVYDASYVNTTVVIIQTFNDSARLQKDRLFSLGDTIYATTFDVSGRVHYHWFDGNGTVVRDTDEIPVGPSGNINDQYTSNTTNAPGNWIIIVHNKKLEETARVYFSVVEITPPYWANNKTNATATTKTGENVYFNITLYDNYAGGYQVFSFYNGTGWANDTAANWTNGIEFEEVRTITATGGMTVRWYWWFNDSAGNTNQTDIWSFTVPNTPPTAPVLDSPVNDYNTTELRPFFNWTASTDTDGDPINYTLYITCNGGCSDDNREYNMTGTNFTLPDDLLYYGDDGYYYNWSVAAWDGYDYNASVESRNLTVYTLIILTLVNNTVDFGSKLVGAKDNTTDDSPSPFVLMNDGNSFIDVNLSASDLLWDSRPNASRYFQFKADNFTGEEDAFNATSSLVNWTNISLSSQTALIYYNHSNATDEAEVDILIEVPLDESAGTKSSTLLFAGEYVG